MKTEISTYEQQAIDFLQSTQTEFKSEYLRFDSMPFDKDGAKRNIFKITLSNSKHSFSFEFGSSINDSTKPTTRKKIESELDTKIYYGFRHSGLFENLIFGHVIETSYPQLLAIKEGRENYEVLLNRDQIEKDYNQYKNYLIELNTKVSKQFGRSKTINGTLLDDIYARIRKRITDAIKEAETETETLYTEQADEIKHPTTYDVLTCLTKYDPGTFENFCSEFGYDTDSRSAMRTYKAVRKEWQNVSKLFAETELEQLQEIQ